MADHTCCRWLLQWARKEAKKTKTEIPCKMASVKTGELVFVRGVLKGEVYKRYVSACCSYEAKAKIILAFIYREE